MMYNMNMLKNKFISFIIFAIITYSASFIGSIATISYKEPWYSTLNKSVLTPPGLGICSSMDNIISFYGYSYLVSLA